MSADVQMLEKPIKYALIAMAAFVVSAFILGNAYEVLALSSLGMPLSATWDQVEAISGLTIDRGMRYAAFYFVCFLAFSCYARSELRSSAWGILVLLVIGPIVMAFVPYLSSEEIKPSSVWAITAVLLSLLYLGVGHKHPSKLLRGFFCLLMAALILMHVMRDVIEWGNAMNAQAVKLFGEEAANKRVNGTFFWFVPAELMSVGVQMYLLYWLPQKFFSELKGNDSQANP
jgi:hypothetical protein